MTIQQAEAAEPRAGRGNAGATVVTVITYVSAERFQQRRCEMLGLDGKTMAQTMRWGRHDQRRYQQVVMIKNVTSSVAEEVFLQRGGEVMLGGLVLQMINWVAPMQQRGDGIT